MGSLKLFYNNFGKNEGFVFCKIQNFDQNFEDF